MLSLCIKIIIEYNIVSILTIIDPVNNLTFNYTDYGFCNQHLNCNESQRSENI